MFDQQPRQGPNRFACGRRRIAGPWASAAHSSASKRCRLAGGRQQHDGGTETQNDALAGFDAHTGRGRLTLRSRHSFVNCTSLLHRIATQCKIYRKGKPTMASARDDDPFTPGGTPWLQGDTEL